MTRSITVNGNPSEVPDDTTVADLVARLALPDRGVALALDGAVVPRSRWVDTSLQDEARVEIVTAMQGG